MFRHFISSINIAKLALLIVVSAVLESNATNSHKNIAGVNVKIIVHSKELMTNFPIEPNVIEYQYNLDTESDIDSNETGLKSLVIYKLKDLDKFWFHLDFAIPIPFDSDFHTKSLSNDQSNLTFLFKHQGEYIIETFHQEDEFSYSNFLQRDEVSHIRFRRTEKLIVDQLFNLGSEVFEIITLDGIILLDVLEKASQAEVMQLQFNLYGYPELKYNVIEMDPYEKQAITNMVKVFKELTKTKQQELDSD